MFNKKELKQLQKESSARRVEIDARVKQQDDAIKSASIIPFTSEEAHDKYLEKRFRWTNEGLW